MRIIIQDLGSNIQGNNWACLGCSLWSFGGLWDDPPLADVLHDSYNTHEMVGYRIHIWAIVLGPLHHWWGSLFNLLAPISRVTTEYIWGVVWGHGVVCGVIHTCQTWSISYNINETVGYYIHNYIIVLRPIHHYQGPWFKLFIWISRVTAEHIWGVVWGHGVVCRVIHPCQET